MPLNGSPQGGTVGPKAAARCPSQHLAGRKTKAKDPFPALQFRRWQGRLVAAIKPVLLAAKLDTDHQDRECKDWASRAPNGFAGKAPRQGPKKEGKPEYVATAAVLQWIYDCAKT